MSRSQKIIIALVCFIGLLGWAVGSWWYLRKDEIPQNSIVSENQEFTAHTNQLFKISNTNLEFKIESFGRSGQQAEDYPIVQWYTHGEGEVREGCFEEYVMLNEKYYSLRRISTDHKTQAVYQLQIYDGDEIGSFGFKSCDS